jgi:hypothetical protein
MSAPSGVTRRSRQFCARRGHRIRDRTAVLGKLAVARSPSSTNRTRT